MMNYSKTKYGDEKTDRSQGLIVVGKKDDSSYYIHSQNFICNSDKEVIDIRLDEIGVMSKEEIKKRYRELRRSGKNTHGKGGGIGFYEIAKRCDRFYHEFKPINEDKFHFQFKAIVDIK